VVRKNIIIGSMQWNKATPNDGQEEETERKSQDPTMPFKGTVNSLPSTRTHFPIALEAVNQVFRSWPFGDKSDPNHSNEY
jgi:hypothetical protein